MILVLLLESIYLLASLVMCISSLNLDLKYNIKVFAKVEKILGKYKKLCRYCEGEDSYLFWPPPVLFGKLKIF